MPLLEVPDLPLVVEPGSVVVSKGGGVLWARLAGAPSTSARPVLYKGTDIASWSPAQRRAAGILPLFGRPHAPRGMTLAELVRISGCPPAGLRTVLRARAQDLGLPEGLLDKPLDDDAWDEYGSQAEWLQAVMTRPELVVAVGARPPGLALDCAAVLL